MTTFGVCVRCSERASTLDVEGFCEHCAEEAETAALEAAAEQSAALAHAEDDFNG